MTWHPPFKVDGQHGAVLRYTARDGRKRASAGRRSFVYGWVYANAVLTGQSVLNDYEMRVTPDGPWHRLKNTPEEIAERLAADPLGRVRLRRLAKRADYALSIQEVSVAPVTCHSRHRWEDDGGRVS